MAYSRYGSFGSGAGGGGGGPYTPNTFIYYNGTSLTSDNTFTYAGSGNIHTLTGISTSDVPLVVQGLSGQTGYLQNWTVAGTSVGTMSPAGLFSTAGNQSAANGAATMGVNPQGQAAFNIYGAVGNGYASCQIARGGSGAQSASIAFLTASTYKWFFGMLENDDNFTIYSFGAASPVNQFGFAASSTTRQTLYTIDAASKGLVIRGAASQSANLQEWQNSSAATVATLAPAGVFTTASNIVAAGGNVYGNTNFAFMGMESGTGAAVVVSNGVASSTGYGNFQSVRLTTSQSTGLFFCTGGTASAGFDWALVTLENTSNLSLFDSTAGVTTVFGKGFSTTRQKISCIDAPSIGLAITAASSQTASMQTWNNNSGTAVSLVDASGNIKTNVAGVGYYVKEGTNACMGLSTLSGGTVVVSNTKVTANSRIFLTAQGGTLANIGAHYISARTAGTSFTISSTNALDASSVAWQIVEPA